MLEHPYVCDVNELRSKLADYEFSGWDLSMHISSPRELLGLLETRDSIAKTAKPGMALPTDIFLFTSGEPSRRDVTKVGGLPYRPAGLEWPTYQSKSDEDREMHGSPLTFLAQFRFTESMGDQGNLPGDVMLIFSYPDCLWEEPDQNIKIEWYPLGLDNLCDLSELPDPMWSFLTGYGTRFRTVDFPFAFDTEIEDCGFNGHGIQCLNCTKIGGFPIGIVDMPEDDVRTLEKDLVGRQVPGINVASITLTDAKGDHQFLCSLGSIQFVVDQDWPMIHSRPPISLEDIRKCDEFMIGYDMWAVDFFMDSNGAVEWRMVWP